MNLEDLLAQLGLEPGDLSGEGDLEFEDVEVEADEALLRGPPMRIVVPPGEAGGAAETGPSFDWREFGDFEPILEEANLPIEEVRFGNTRSDGGTRKEVVKLGGERAMPFYMDAENPNDPVPTFDVFDMRIGLPRSIRQHFDEVMEDPGEWAKRSVEEFGAEMVTVHLVSTDPNVEDRSPGEASKAVEDVLEAVDVPVVIGGSGNPSKDVDVLVEAAGVAEGERCLLASANMDLDNQRLVDACQEYDHNLLSFVSMDINAQKELNRKLLKMGLDRDRLVMDPTTAALGYGLDYSLSLFQRLRLDGLGGDEEVNFPLSSAGTNAWGARESWMKAGDRNWGDRMKRGPLWETITGLTLILSGADLLMALHPKSVSTIQEVVERMNGRVDRTVEDNWITAV
ncbi:MAG: Acetyl-CoA decarbonylase/synthase complex subunit delta 1 [Methanonatronarchaeales archaeon]|nr:Acetyl-CoA decarbonylase/synthase complex subunit delta 1 [Methanonatronarchaeales archaeon]